MKNAIGYIRISTKDQSNFSIPAQKQFIQDYCTKKDIRLLNEFVDNGQSAKNFDRADWKNLEKFVKANYNSIDYLIVVKYDRFSRNVSEGLNMIETLEKKYKISVLSIFEEIAISPESPFFFKMRADMLVQAEFELRVIKDRTKFGIKQAKESGRWLTVAPYGYVNKRDAQNKPIIEVDEQKNTKGFTKQEIVKEIFTLFMEGVPIKRIFTHIKDMGYNQKGNSAVVRILNNPVYCGLIQYNQKLFKGIHVPIISLNDFNYCQALMTKETKVKVLINDEVPLRGVLKCQCGKYLTAGKSKGKSQYYWYYKCSAHLTVNYNSVVIHHKLKDLLTGLSINDEIIEGIKEKVRGKLNTNIKERNIKSPQIRKKIKDVEVKLSSLEEKFILNQINSETYGKWNSIYHLELNELSQQLKICEAVAENLWVKYADYTHNLTNLLGVYEKANTIQKQKLLNVMFNYSLKYELNTFFTDNVLPMLASNTPLLIEKGLLIISKPFNLEGKNPISTRDGSIIELFELIKSIDNKQITNLTV